MMKKYWWVWLVLIAAVVWVFYQILSGKPSIAKTLTVGTNQKQISATAPAAAATAIPSAATGGGTSCVCACTIVC
jgi:uncharacterized membrane protein YraQ (UPF0718 family)